MNILYLTTVLPNRKSGGEIASEAFINGLKTSGCKVTVLGYQRNLSEAIINSNYRSAGIRPIETAASKLFAVWWMVQAFVSRRAYSVQKFISSEYVNCVSTLLAQESYDAIIIDHSQMSWVHDYVPESYPVIFIAHNVENEIYRDQAKYSLGLRHLIYDREAGLMQKLEKKLTSASHQIWTLTENDYDYFAEIAGLHKVSLFEVPSLQSDSIVSNGSRPKKYDVGIIGTWTWDANHKGLVWFFEKVYPLLQKEISIKIAGKGADWLLEKYPNVEYCGFVPSAEDFMSDARVVAIPSVSGGGIQIKTLDAITSGAQIVATSFALRGIAGYPDTVRLSDTPESFANAIFMLLSSTFVPATRSSIEWARARNVKFLQDIKRAVTHL